MTFKQLVKKHGFAVTLNCDCGEAINVEMARDQIEFKGNSVIFKNFDFPKPWKMEKDGRIVCCEK